MDQPTVAILGASADRAKFGNKSVRAHADRGYLVFPVNPKGGTIEGLAVVPRLAEVPVPRLDRISVYLPPPLALAALPEIAAARASEVYFNPGSDSPEVLAEARRLGIPAIQACSIVELGTSPGKYPD